MRSDGIALGGHSWGSFDSITREYANRGGQLKRPSQLQSNRLTANLMDDQNNHASTRQEIPIRDLKAEPGADELLESPAMEPYLNLAIAIMGGKDTGPAIEALTALPLEERYVWRVASALKWAFADFDTLTVEADRQTIPPEDRTRLVELLKNRPLQFCLFLSALLGEKQMELLMISAIRNARAIAAHSEGQG